MDPQILSCLRQRSDRDRWFFFLTDTPTPEIYTLSLHDALPICFHAGRGLIGHNFGNLFLAALTHVTGDFTKAIRVSSKVLAIRGRIFPSTLSNVHLVATLENGRTVHGETRITASRTPIKKLKLS